MVPLSNTPVYSPLSAQKLIGGKVEDTEIWIHSDPRNLYRTTFSKVIYNSKPLNNHGECEIHCMLYLSRSLHIALCPFFNFSPFLSYQFPSSWLSLKKWKASRHRIAQRKKETEKKRKKKEKEASERKKNESKKNKS